MVEVVICLLGCGVVYSSELNVDMKAFLWVMLVFTTGMAIYIGKLIGNNGTVETVQNVDVTHYTTHFLLLN